MATEVMELKHHPIWEQQPEEPPEKHSIFERFFLPGVKPNLTECYRKYRLEKDGSEQQITDVPSGWRRDCDRFRWRERHTAFWRWKNQSDAQWREEQIRKHHSQNLDTAALLRDRAMEALEQIEVENVGAKDIAALLRLSQELTESALQLSDLNKAIAKVFAAGYEVVECAENEVLPLETV